MMRKRKYERYAGMLGEAPHPTEIPFDLQEAGITYEQFVAIWKRVKDGAPQFAAWRAAGLPGRYNEVWTLWMKDKEELQFEETKCYIYFDKLYYDCLCQVSSNLYKHATSDSKSAVNAAKLLLEYNEEMQNNANKRGAV